MDQPLATHRLTPSGRRVMTDDAVHPDDPHPDAVHPDEEER
jgi:hypothetical protein